MKKVSLFVFLAVLASLGLAGCSASAEVSTETTGGSSAPEVEAPAPMEEGAYLALMKESHGALVESAQAAAPNAAKLTEES